MPSFILFWPLINRGTAILGFLLLNKLGPLVAKNQNTAQGTLCYGQGPTLPSFILICPRIMPLTAILVLDLLNKLAPWWPKRKNKTTFNIKIPPIYINKVALFSSFDPFKGPKQPFQGSGYKINSAPWWPKKFQKRWYLQNAPKIIWAKFHVNLSILKATFVASTRTEVIPLPSYTEKGKALASLGP